jgi:tRNA threonylcarbamoyl adenosine modification protein (Sua5/YciO/YrdC/YwlC family)
MKSISFSGNEIPSAVADEVAGVLLEGALVCIPTPSGYKIVADFTSPRAVISMLQAKRRVQNAPALVLVPDKEWLFRIAEEASEDARRLMAQFWPGPLTLLCTPSQEMDPALRKSLTRAKGWIGVRMPDDDISRAILNAVKRPLVVSSANLARKGGDGSVAQVKKNFGRNVQLMVEKGDIASVEPSTLVDVSDGPARVVREGALSAEQIAAALQTP